MECYRIKCQTLYRHNHRRFFPVSCIDDERMEVDDIYKPDATLGNEDDMIVQDSCVAMLTSQLRQAWRSGVIETTEETLHQSVISHFIKEVGFHGHVEFLRNQYGLEKIDLYRKVHDHPKEHDWFTVIDSWLCQRMRWLKDSVRYLARREVIRETASDNKTVLSNRGLSDLQEGSTRQRYARSISQLIMFTLKASNEDFGRCTWSLVGTDHLLKLLRDMQALVVTEDEDEDAPPPELTQSQITQFRDWMDEAMYRFVGFRLSSFTDKQTVMQTPLEQYVALAQLNQSGSFDSANDMTRRLAELQYCIRLGILSYTKRLVSADPDKEDEITKRCFSCITDEHYRSPFVSLRQWMKLGTSVVYNTP